jgi:hypothetical protein
MPQLGRFDDITSSSHGSAGQRLRPARRGRMGRHRAFSRSGAAVLGAGAIVAAVGFSGGRDHGAHKTSKSTGE